MPKPNHDLLIKGILCTLIGLAVLLAPSLVPSPELQAITSGAALAGWFALVLGLALLLRVVMLRRSKRGA